MAKTYDPDDIQTYISDRVGDVLNEIYGEVAKPNRVPAKEFDKIAVKALLNRATAIINTKGD